MKKPPTPPPFDLRTFVVEWLDAGKPDSFTFSSEESEGAEIVGRIHKLNRWRLRAIDFFSDYKLPQGINVEEANTFFGNTCGLRWDEVERLLFRCDPPPKSPAHTRKLIIHLMKVLSFEPQGPIMTPGPLMTPSSANSKENTNG